MYAAVPSAAMTALKRTVTLCAQIGLSCPLALLRARGSIGHEHNFAGYASLLEQLVRLSGLNKRKPPGDKWFDLLLVKEVKQGDQILPKELRPEPFEPLYAVGDHVFPARQKPASGNVQSEDSDRTITMATS